MTVRRGCIEGYTADNKPPMFMKGGDEETIQ